MNLTPEIERNVTAALEEDMGSGDLTALLIAPDAAAKARVISRVDCVLCGAPWFDACFRRLDPQVRITWQARDGDAIAAGQTLCVIEGNARALLTGERTALNFLQTLSGTATAAAHYVEAVAGTGCRILDTRKTLPGLRLAQKYAARCGGAQNHRMGLYDMVLIKENHIIAAGSIGGAVATARRTSPGIPVEVEVETLAEFDQACESGADIILLDELSLDDMREAVKRNRARSPAAKLEASGSVKLSTVREIALTGVDFISIGSITKHVHAVDLSMRLEFVK